MFNDKVQMGFFDRYDQYILNVIYDPRIAPGMSKAEVMKLLPEILPDIRRRVSNLNSMPRLQQSSLPSQGSRQR
jgi:hypothetical protein